MDGPRCIACGNRGRLSPEGRCRWQGGCDHRIEVAEATRRALAAQLAANDPSPRYVLAVPATSMGMPEWVAEILRANAAAAYQFGIEVAPDDGYGLPDAFPDGDSDWDW